MLTVRVWHVQVMLTFLVYYTKYYYAGSLLFRDGRVAGAGCLAAVPLFSRGMIDGLTAYSVQ